MKKFDLNIEEILENWEPRHAVREIIANALDEQKLTKTEPIKIYTINNNWYIRDYGRGIIYEHFTQKENVEKLNTEGLIGKFGIGLKDALATFNRKGISCQIKSKHGVFKIGKSKKTGFEEIETLHVYIEESIDSDYSGTEFVLGGLLNPEMEAAKDFFLEFNDEKIIDTTETGQIIEHENYNDVSNIYINGVKVSEEPNFLFSYNITKLNKAIQKALNRERSHVGRSAYTSSIKAILLSSENGNIAKKLSNDLTQFSSGNIHDELKWLDVQSHAASILNKFKNVVFVTPEEIEKGNDIIDEARKSNIDVVTISGALKQKLTEVNETERQKLEEDPEAEVEIVRTFNDYTQERSDNFEFDFVSEDKLNYSELQKFKKIERILKLIGGKPYNVREVLISETMQRDNHSFMPAGGLWLSSQGRVIIKRSQLSSLNLFAGTLIHEIAHARSGASDATREFESKLTDYCGLLASQLLDLKDKLDSINILEIEKRNDKNISNLKFSHENKIKGLKFEFVEKLKTKLAQQEVKIKNNERSKSILKKIFNK